MSPTTRLGVAGAVAALAVLGAVAFGLPSRGGQVPASAVSENARPATAEAAAAPTEHAHSGGVAESKQEPANDRAARLIAATRRSARQWRNVNAARADGYRSIGDEITGHEHYVQWDWAQDDAVLDPRRPESLVYEVDGMKRRLVSAMYILPPGSTMRDVPDIGDERAQWHRHTNLCWSGRTLAGLYYDGRCVPAGERRATTPMLHVWLTRNRCGPFAGLGVHRGHCDAS